MSQCIRWAHAIGGDFHRFAYATDSPLLGSPCTVPKTGKHLPLGLCKETVKESTHWVTSWVYRASRQPWSQAWRCSQSQINTLRKGQNGFNITDDILKFVFLNENSRIFYSNFTEVCSIDNKSSLVQGNGLVPIRWQAIIWTNDDPVESCINGLPGFRTWVFHNLICTPSIHIP